MLDRSSFRDTPIVLPEWRTFLALPPIYQWEFRRRHPYYVRHWQQAQRLCEYEAQPEQLAKLDSKTKSELMASRTLLIYIGLLGKQFPDPAIDGRTSPGFIPPFDMRLAQPVSLRQHLLYTLLYLPPRVQHTVTRVFLRELLSVTSSTEGKDMLQALTRPPTPEQLEVLDLQLAVSKGHAPLFERFIDALRQLSEPELDEEIPNFLLVNFGAPEDDIVCEVKAVIKQQKEKRAATETRRRPNKWDDYLDVWDRREGWVGGKYDGQQEHRLSDIAKELRIPISTAQAHYKAAFRLIVGQEYDPDLWLALVGSLKCGDLKSKWGTWRRSKQSAPTAPRAASAGLTPETMERGSGWKSVATSDDHKDYVDLITDLKDLIGRGRSNEEIVAELELEWDPDRIEFVRERVADGLF